MSKQPAYQVLIWSEDPLQAHYLQQLYQQAGFAVSVYAGYQALKKQALALKAEPVAVILNLSRQPEVTYKHLRSLHQQLPLAVLIVLSSHQDPEVNQAALAAGADDCLIQPLDTTELIGRTRARLKRTQTFMQSLWRLTSSKPLQFGVLQLNPERREAILAEHIVRLTQTEFALLHVLAHHANQRLSRDQIYQQLWQTREPAGSRRLDNFVLSLRKKLPLTPDCELNTYYGEGFCLKLKL